jgi:outer membrane immunogenic protein
MGLIMRRLQCVLLTAVAVIGFASVASAADLPVKGPVYKAPLFAAYNWSGFYLGIEGGAAWGRSQVTSADPIDNPGLPITDPFNVSGGLFGGTIGYNWQVNSWVFGVEGDLSWVSKKGTVNDIPPFTLTWTNTTNEKWLGTGRVRVGFTPVDRWLIYATGGFAVADVEATVTTALSGPYSETQTRWGWTVGGGVEAALNQNWSVKLEYLFVDLQDKNYFSPDITTPAGGIVLTRTVTLNDNIVRAGINYKF